MSGEIFKVPQRTGERGRPKEIPVLGGKLPGVTEPKIVGSKTAGDPQIVDGSTPGQEAPVDVRVHSDVVIEDQGNIRTTPTEHPEVELRVRRGSAKEFDAIKRGDD